MQDIQLLRKTRFCNILNTLGDDDDDNSFTVELEILELSEFLESMFSVFEINIKNLLRFSVLPESELKNMKQLFKTIVDRGTNGTLAVDMQTKLGIVDNLLKVKKT